MFHASTEPKLDNVEEEEEDVPPAKEDIFLGGGLFHSSSDCPQNELASEEDILRSLKLGTYFGVFMFVFIKVSVISK